VRPTASWRSANEFRRPPEALRSFTLSGFPASTARPARLTISLRCASRADGAPLDWRRDPNDLYAFHVDVPAGTQAIDAQFDVLMNASGDVMSSHSLAIVNWNRALLYQDGIDSHRYFVKPSIVLPSGWDFATALRGATQSGNRVDFA